MTAYKFPSSRVSQPALKETVLCGVLQLLDFLAVWLRLWSRRINRKRLEANDYAILAALFFSAGLLGIAIFSTVWTGKGFHTHDIDPAYRSRVFIAFTAGQLLWGAANTCVKFSILHLYLVIFPGKRFRRACYVLMGIATCYFVAVFLETFLLCKPVEYNWNKKIKGRCDTKADKTYLSAGIINLICDIFVIAMPMPLLFRLTLPTGKKIGLIAVFGVGAVVCVVSLLRVVYISRMNLHDFHYTYADLGMWSIVEAQVGIINACMPVMQPLVRRVASMPAYRHLMPSSWIRSSSDRSATLVDGKSSVRDNTMDRMYPLDTVHLVGKGDHDVTEIVMDIERP